MSTIIMSACWPLQMPSSQKAVLISLADNANDDGVCWPSIDKIVERTCLTDRTVQKCLKWLEDRGAISRQRRHKRSAVYTVTPPRYQAWRRDESLPEESSPEESSPEESSPENPSPENPSPENPSPENPSPEKFAGRPENECALDRKKMQFRPENPSPITVKEPTKEPSMNHHWRGGAPCVSETQETKKSKPPAVVGVAELVAEGVDRQHAMDWLRVRKEKRLPLTLTAWSDVKAEAAKAGITPADAVRISATNSWAGFRSSWLGAAQNGAGGAATDPLAWATTWTGIVNEGAKHGVVQAGDELAPSFKARVMAAAGLTDADKARLRADFGVNV